MGSLEGTTSGVSSVIRGTYLAISGWSQVGKGTKMREVSNQVLAIWGQLLQKLLCSLLDYHETIEV